MELASEGADRKGKREGTRRESCGFFAQDDSVINFFVGRCLFSVRHCSRVCGRNTCVSVKRTGLTRRASLAERIEIFKYFSTFLPRRLFLSLSSLSRFPRTSTFRIKLLATRVKSLIGVFIEERLRISSEGREGRARRAISLIEFQCVRRPSARWRPRYHRASYRCSFG